MYKINDKIKIVDFTFIDLEGFDFETSYYNEILYLSEIDEDDDGNPIYVCKSDDGEFEEELGEGDFIIVK